MKNADKEVEKDAEIGELLKENLELKDKIGSLLDILYGCNECGRHGDFCECDVNDEENVDPSCPS